MRQNLMWRAFELARLGMGQVSPNPNVGAIIVDNQRIVGEGWHEKYGTNHAEINAIQDANKNNVMSLFLADMYVSLEPCSIHGKTPPCTSAIIDQQIPNVYISAKDDTDGVKDVSAQILGNHQVNLVEGILKQYGELLVAPRNTFVSEGRPYVILKWAQSKDGYISKKNESTPISNAITRRYVHKLRAQVDAIMVGRKTAEIDNPSLTTRYYPGSSPIKVVIASELQNQSDLPMLQDDDTLVLTSGAQQLNDIKNVFQVKDVVRDGLTLLADRKIAQLLVEGGSQTLTSFLDSGLWDEIQVITNSKILDSGISAPLIHETAVCTQSFEMIDDKIDVFHHPRHIV